MPTAARLAVARALQAVFVRGSRVPQGWDARLSGEDSALAQAILGRTLRAWGRLQAWVLPRLKQQGRGIPPGSQIALSMGLAQLAWLDGVSDHAAVHETVELVQDPELGFPPHRGLVNALLRQASKDRGSLRKELEGLDPALDRTPFVERILDAAAGPDPRRRATLWERLQRIPGPAFRCLRGEIPPGLEPDPALPGGLRRVEGAPFPQEWLRSGAGMVQDRSSQALMGFRWGQQPPRRILDACAAPGGKTTALAARFPGSELIALEKDPRRARRLGENLRVREVPAQIVVAEAVEWLGGSPAPFDLIVVDAPCSGSGTLAKHPELTWIGDQIDLTRLVEQQATLLEAAIAALAPGALLVYAVCSWFPDEGEAHATRIKASHPELETADVWPRAWGPEGLFRPDSLDWDGEGFQGLAFRAPSLR
jgi:16S rRNA (cytosine967-C5)-methyltransferase